MFIKQPLFDYIFTIFYSNVLRYYEIGTLLKQFSQKTSYSIFDKTFTPIQ